jgi:hypothetical protein
MANHIDAHIDTITQAHVAECEKANVSRNVDETKRRVKDVLAQYSAMEILASGYWEGLHDAAKVAAIRAAVLELGQPVKVAKAPDPEPDEDEITPLEKSIEDAGKPKSKRGTKGKVLV